jgi:hypothetical protein
MSDSVNQSEKKRWRVGDGTPGPGRPKGSTNRATDRTRAAIAMIAEDMADDFKTWIQKTAKEDPKGAADLYLKAIEYHIPKLARTESHHSVTEESHEQWLARLK